jgi:hypothetical protein
MIHEHELELAAAAIDFELTPAERRRLDAAIADCSVCARAAASYRRDATMLAALPVVDASPTVRRQVERAAGLRPQRTSLNWVFLAAAMLGLLITSAVAIGAFNQLRRNDLSQVELSPTPTKTPAPSAAPPSVPVPDVIALDPPSGNLANVGPPLAHDSMALVVTDDLRIRSAPFVGDLSTKYQRLLDKDDRLFVIDGPVIAQNYEWYQVKAWRSRSPSVSWPVGWVARAGHDGEVWFRSTTVSCPASPISVEALLELAPADRLACYGDTTLQVRAVVGTAAVDCDPARSGCPTGPEWLARSALRASISASVDAPAAGVSIALDPGAGLDPGAIERAGVVRLRGTFDHADARSCGPDPERAGPSGPLSPTEAVLECRTRFVVTAATPETFPRLDDVSGKTVSDRVRVRSLPEISDASIKYEPLLPLGTKVTVLDGPVLGDGYAWYHVTAVVTSRQRGVQPIELTGWVAAAGLDGERWLQASEPSS